MYGYGHIADPAGHMVTGAHVMLGAIRAPAPMRSVILTTAPIFDQGPTSACVGYATARGIHTSLNGQIPFPDPVELYRLARILDRLDKNEVLQDVGSMPNQAMRALTEWGAAPWTIGNAERELPADPTTVNDEPDFLEQEQAAHFKLKGYYRIDDASATARMQRMAQCIDRGIACPFAVMVDQDFEDNAGELLGTPDPNGILGGHYVCAIGYETTASGLIQILFGNSWTKSWGDKGFGRGGNSFFEGATDTYAMNLEILS